MRSHRMANANSENRIEYASALWEEEPLSEFAVDGNVPAKYRSTVSNIMSRHGVEIRLLSEETVPTASHVSKKKLKDLIVKQNNELFSFMGSEKSSVLRTAETIFRRYGQEVPTIKSAGKSAMLKELNLDASLDTALIEIHEGLMKLQGEGGLEDFMAQMRWITSQYKTIGEEVLRLETTLFQKIELLDKLNNRIPLITSLQYNDQLPTLIDAFSEYAKVTFHNSKFEENYKEVVEMYKKWNVCRQVLSFPNMLRSDGSEPQCSICLMDHVSYAIVPCGHTFCSNCTKKQNTTCYICRGPIRERVKLYFA